RSRPLGRTLLKRVCTRWLFAIVIAGFVLVASSRSAFAQRRTAPQLLPHSTLAVVRIADMPTLVERVKATALGRVGQAPQMKPLIADLYRSAQDAFEQVEDRVGLPLDQLLKIPQGEVCVAFVATEDFDQEAGFFSVLSPQDQVMQC